MTSACINQCDNQSEPSSTYIEELNTNFNNAYQFINQLFIERSRILVIRLDFGVNRLSNNKYDAYYLRDCLNQFLNNRRQKPSLFQHCLGYMWTLELGQEKGFHYHCFFFFDGAYSQQDISIGHGIGQYWRQITQGEGAYYCSNDDKLQFEQLGTCGVGMMHRHDLLKRQNLTNLLGYLFKDVQSTRSSIAALGVKNIRLFGKGR